MHVIRFRFKEKPERVSTLLDYYSLDFRSKINCYLYKVIVTVVQRLSPVNFYIKLTFQGPRSGVWSVCVCVCVWGGGGGGGGG